METVKREEVTCCSWGLKTSTEKIIGIVVFGIVLLAAIFQNEFFSEEEGTISATAQASVPIKLDQAIVNLGVATFEAHTPGEALRQTTEKINKIKMVLSEMQIPESDWQITAYAFDPQEEEEEKEEDFSTDDNESRNSTSGTKKVYDGFQRITVRLSGIDEDMKKVDAFIERMMKEGVNKVGEVEFESSNEEKAREEARQKAIQIAKEKASILGKSLGVKLGKLYDIEEEEITQDYDEYYQSSIEEIIREKSYPQSEVTMEVTLYYNVR